LLAAEHDKLVESPDDWPATTLKRDEKDEAKESDCLIYENKRESGERMTSSGQTDKREKERERERLR
jgi:hypothetical protein